MEIEFTIHLLDDDYRHLSVAEHDLSESFTTFEERLLAREELEGDLVFKLEGFPNFEFTDLLLVSVQGLCFKFVAQALQENIEAFSYKLWVDDEQVDLHLMTGYVQVMMDEMPTVTYPKEDFLRALFACGMRYIAFVQKLESLGRADWSIAKLKEQAEITSAALATHL